MIQAAHVRPALGIRRAHIVVDPCVVGTVGLILLAFALRLAAADQQSAYMDEGTNILTGRLLIEQHAVYAEILNWAYGSYLWPLVAGVADEWGGLGLVRGVTALGGVVMVLATALAAYRLAPEDLSEGRRRAVALVAGWIMAVAPTAIGVGRFGTYDALAGAGFMLGVSLLVPVRQQASPIRLLSAAGLLFVAFLAKYLVAIYFPVVCLYLMLGVGRHYRHAFHNILWFVAPLFAACVVYLAVFLGPLLTLLSSSLHYGDLKSPDPLREYVWMTPELWLLLAVAALGFVKASRHGRGVAIGGAAIILLFQLEARPDFDFWKHSIYVLFFVAPLAALVSVRVPQHTGTWRVVATGTLLVASWAVWSPSIAGASRVVHFYPNLNSSVQTIDQQVGNAALVLTDDTALRYYLYPRIGTDRVVGPFFFAYRGYDGIEGYRRAVADRFFDAIVLDGGVTPQGAAIRQQVGATINEFYQRVYSQSDGSAFTIEIYKPVRPQGATGANADDASLQQVVTFDQSTENWGAHPDTSDWQAGLQIEPSPSETWEGLPSLAFSPKPSAATLSMRRSGHVTRVRARLLLQGTDSASTAPIRVGFVGFDDTWQWHDDGFRWVVPPGTWTTITWDLPTPDNYEELGLQFPPDLVARVYLGAFEIDP